MPNTCLPGDAPTAFAILNEELRRLADGALPEDAILRAQLTLVCRLVRQLGDPADAFANLRWMARFAEVPSDPVAAVMALEPAQVQAVVARCLAEKSPVFSVTGPLFEEDIDLFVLP